VKPNLSLILELAESIMTYFFPAGITLVHCLFKDAPPFPALVSSNSLAIAFVLLREKVDSLLCMLHSLNFTLYDIDNYI